MSQTARQRQQMVKTQLRGRDIRDPAILAAFETVPRHRFLPSAMWATAYADRPLPIGEGQTISQPYIVVFMLQALNLQQGYQILEIGAGCGYVTALLIELGMGVHALEIDATLAGGAAERLRELGYEGADLRCGDGWQGWPEATRFDAIIVSAAAVRIPPVLPGQLRSGGRLVIPVGEARQELVLVQSTPQGTCQRCLATVRFVPLRQGS